MAEGTQLWSLQEIWNKQLTLGRTQRELTSREHIWASEIGKNHFERYLKMTAVKPDKDYDERTLRKFAAGDFFERIIAYVLITAGLLKHDNKWYEIPATDQTLRVSVKPDFIAGGKPDWAKIKQDLKSNLFFEIMPVLEGVCKSLVEFLSEKYPDGLKDIVYEIKSLNSQVFWAKRDYLQNAYLPHRLQALTELKATGMPEARLLYISKDDLTVAEFPVFASDPDLNRVWEEDVRLMTHYIKTKTLPPKPDAIVLDPRSKIRFQLNKQKYEIVGAYTENYEIKWSNYITKMGYKDEDDYLNAIKPLLKQKNDELKEQFKITQGLVKGNETA